jgi:GTP-binding protein
VLRQAGTCFVATTSSYTTETALSLLPLLLLLLPFLTWMLLLLSLNNTNRALQCRLVDVPGLGFARAEAGRMDSWRSTLQRYLTVRNSLRGVFHLVDARTGPQAADTELMSMALSTTSSSSTSSSSDDEASAADGEAAAAASTNSSSGKQYVVVLTKADKASKAQIAATRKAVLDALSALGVQDCTFVLSSSKDRVGRDALWGEIWSLLKPDTQ